MDTTPLDVFAVDPQTLQWVGVELTVAMDCYSCCIVGLALTPTTKVVDVAVVLYQAFRPARAAQDWPEEAVWPPHGPRDHSWWKQPRCTRAVSWRQRRH
jgi:hypothetical protein